MVTKHESLMRDSVSSNSKHRKHRRRELTRGVVLFEEIQRAWKYDETMSRVFFLFEYDKPRNKKGKMYANKKGF